MELQGLGKWLLLVGLGIALLGLFFIWSPKVPFLGKLPGDIFLKREGFTFYFPLVTSLLLSLLVSLVLYWMRKGSN